MSGLQIIARPVDSQTQLCMSQAFPVSCHYLQHFIDRPHTMRRPNRWDICSASSKHWHALLLDDLEPHCDCIGWDTICGDTCGRGDHQIVAAEVGHGLVGAEVTQQLRIDLSVQGGGKGLSGPQVQSVSSG